MANKLIKNKHNKYLALRNNYYAFGDFLFNKDKDGNVNNRSLNNLNAGALSALSAAGTLAGGLIGGGLQSKAGSAMNGLSNIASAIPGVGGFISAGLGVAGGITNSLFGSKLNEENIAKVENNINALNSFQTNASDFDNLSQQWNSAPVGMTFSNDFIGSDGLFSNKAKNKANSLRNQVRRGENWVQSSLENNAINISNSQMQNLLANYSAFGGNLMTHGANFNTGLTVIGNGGTHEQNPFEGVPMGVDPEGVPNLVEEGEVIFNDYVFSNRLKVPKAVRNKYKLRGTKSLTFADAAIQMSKESEERPNDEISQRGFEDSMMKLMIAQEEVRSKRDKQTSGNRFDEGGDKETVTRMPTLIKPIHTLIDPYGVSLNDIYSYGLASTPISKPPVDAIENNIPTYQRTVQKKLLPTWSRKLPAYASGIMSLTDALGWTNKPDYSDADAVLDASREAGTYNPIKFNPVGNYLTYRPFDRDYYTNKLNAESSATRRAILNTSSGNRAQAMAGILAADYNAQDKMGDLFRQAEEYNLAQKQKAEEFNRATDMFNSEGIFKADQANQSAQLQAKSSYLKGALTAAELKQKERQVSTAARSANLSNFINSWGDIGRENFIMNMINDNPALYYYLTNQGGSEYKGANKGAEGGLLTIKKRKRRR